MDEDIGRLEQTLRTTPADAKTRSAVVQAYRRAGRFDDANALVLDPLCARLLKEQQFVGRDESQFRTSSTEMNYGLVFYSPRAGFPLLEYCITTPRKLIDESAYCTRAPDDGWNTEFFFELIITVSTTPSETLRMLLLADPIAKFLSTYFNHPTSEFFDPDHNHGELPILGYCWPARLDKKEIIRQFQQTAQYLDENICLPRKTE